ncbi:MAG TPA: zf-TFIIB domain-containing protein [Candidatus Omnitrophota bacterium]|nr:zf-TFIIB domain-containing protein [Candidatus Omnitrophota bacterium]
MTDLSSAAAKNGHTMECPKCLKPLTVRTEDGLEMDYCEACHGVWVDHLKEKKALKIKPEVFSMDELARLRKLYVPLGRREPIRYVPCPVCKQLMNRKIWGSYSGVVVDVCGEHGSWYDAKEIEKVREYVALGGIEYEKMVKTDQGFSDLHSKLIQETTRLDVKISSAYRRARLWSLIGL